MKHLISAASLFCMLTMFSCKEKPASRPSVLNRQLTLPTGNPASTPAQPVLPGTAPAVSAKASGQLNPAHGQPGHRCDIAVGAPLPAASQAANAATASLNTQPVQTAPTLPSAATAARVPANGVNPAHGQPGHRCDIAVGAPLNSKPTATSTNTATPVVNTKPATLPPDTLFAKGLNPAHGQPGHRCDVAVGKPLSEAKKTDSPSPIPLQPPGN